MRRHTVVIALSIVGALCVGAFLAIAMLVEKRSSDVRPLTPNEASRTTAASGRDTADRMTNLEPAQQERDRPLDYDEARSRLYAAIQASPGGQVLTDDIRRELTSLEQAGYDPVQALGELYERGGSERMVII